MICLIAASLLSGCAGKPAPKHINRPVKSLTLSQLCYEMGYAKGQGDTVRLEDVQLEAMTRARHGLVPDISKAQCTAQMESGKEDSDGKELVHNSAFGGLTLGLGLML
ncbi:TPA: hypothetical protein ACGQ50_000797 [Enterobacter cloacae]